MKKLPYILLALIAVCFVACSDDGDGSVSALRTWRDLNNQWLAEQQGRKNPDGTPYYRTIVPKWNPETFVLIHYFNERTNDPNALKPLYTSTVDVRYQLHLYNGTRVDSSLNNTEYGPGVYRAQLNNLIDGWAVGVCDMNVGDSAEVLIPYALGYGAQSSGGVPSFSNLRFNIRLVDIVKYEISPEDSND